MSLDLPLTRNIGADKAPTDMAAYELNGGYQGLRTALPGMTPADCLQAVKDSKLRGRGGAGFPTGIKWSFVPMGDHVTETSDRPGHKYLICNADEMEPGTFKDRLLLECDPHQLIEGMILSAYTIQADVAYIFIRAEYIKAIQLLREAIAACHDKGYLGSNILGTDYSLQMHVHVSAGRYICEEAWDGILLSWQRRCAYCGAAVGTQAVREHNIPLDANGPHDVSNIVPSCTVCNSEKGSYDGQTYHRLRAERGLSTHPMWHDLNPAASDPVLSEIFAEPADNCPCTVSR